MIEDGKSLAVALCVGVNCLDYPGDSDPYDHAKSAEHGHHIEFATSEVKQWNS